MDQVLEATLALAKVCLKGMFCFEEASCWRFERRTVWVGAAMAKHFTGTEEGGVVGWALMPSRTC